MRNTISRGLVALGAALGLVMAHAATARAADKPKTIAIAEVKRTEPVSFEKDVLPIFKKNCLACHNATEAESDLVLETPASIVKGGASGPAVVPNKSGESWLMQVATHAEEPVMPPKDNKVNAKNLTPEELGLIKLWIDQGATGSVSGDKVVWQSLPPGVNPIYAAAVSPDGQYAACGRANQIFIYHIPTGREVCRLTDPALLQGDIYKKPGVAHLDLVQSLAFSPDGQLLASGGFQVVKLWRRPRNTQLHKFASPEGASVVATTADGKWLAIGGGDTIHLWSLATGKPGATLKGHTGAVTCLAFNADGAKLFSGSEDKSVRVWTVADGKLAARIDTPTPIGALTVVGDGSQVATGGGDNAIRLWSVPATPLAELAGVPSPVTAMAASADKKWLALGGGDGKIVLVEADSGKVAKSLGGHTGAITSLSFNAGATRLASGSADKTARVWDLAKGDTVDTLAVSAKQAVSAVALSPDGNQLAAGSGQGAVGLYKVGADRKDPVAKPDQELKGNAKPVTGLVYSTNGAVVYTSSEDGTVRGFQAANGQQSFSANHGAPVHALARSLDGKYLASAGENKEVRVWNSSNGSPAPKNQFAGFEAPVKSVAFTVDNARVVGGAANGETLVFNLASGETEQAFREPKGSVDALAAAGTQSPYIVAVSADKSVRRFAPLAVRTLAGHGKPVTSLATLPSANTQILSGSEDGTVRHWNTANGQATRTMNHGAPVVSVAVRPDGQRFASASSNNTVKLWNGANGQQVAELKGDYRAQALVAHLTIDGNLAKNESKARENALAAAKKAAPPKAEAAKKAAEAMAAAEKTLNEKKKAAEKPTADNEAAKKALADNEKLVQSTTEKAKQAKAALDKDAKNDGLKKAKADADKALADAQKAFKDAETKLKATEKPLADAMKAVTDAQTAFNNAEKTSQQAAVDSKKAQDAIPAAEAELKTAQAEQKRLEGELADAQKASAASEKPFRGVAFSPDNLQLAAVGDDQLVHTYNGETGAAYDVFVGQGASTSNVAFATATTLVSVGDDKNAIVWDTSPAWGLERSLGKSTPLADRVIALDFSPNGKMLAVGGGEPSRSGELKIFNVTDGSLVLDLPEGHSDTVFGVAFSPDGKLIAGAAADKFVKVFQVADGKQVRSFEGHTHHVMGVAWQFDGKLLASSGADNVIKIWDFETGEQKRTITGFKKQFTSISFVGNTNTVVASNGDGQVYIRRSDNGGNVRSFSGAKDYVYAASMSEDGAVLVAGGQDSVLRVWNATNGQVLKTFDPPQPPAQPGDTAAAQK